MSRYYSIISRIVLKVRGSYWLRSGSFTFATKLFESGIGFLTFLVLVRFLSVDNFGTWILFMSFSAINESLRKAFVYIPLVRFLNKRDADSHSQIVTSSIVQNLIFTLVGSAVLFAGAGLFSDILNSPELGPMLRLLAISNLFLGFFSQCNFIQQANLNFKGTFYTFLIRKGAFFLFAAYCFFFYQTATLSTLILAQIAIFILIIPLNILFTRKYFGRVLFSLRELRKLSGFGKYTLATNLSSMAFGNVDGWLLSAMISAKAVALYNPAIRLLALAEIPIVSLATIVYPQLANRANNQDIQGVRRLYERSIGAVLALLIPCCILVIIFSDPIIVLIAGERYLEASEILKITMLFTLIIPFNRQLGVTLNAIGSPGTNTIFAIINLAANILCNYICIKQFGVIGAAYGTLLAYCISLVYGQILAYTLFGTSTIGVLKYAFQFYASPSRLLSLK